METIAVWWLKTSAHTSKSRGCPVPGWRHQLLDDLQDLHAYPVGGAMRRRLWRPSASSLISWPAEWLLQDAGFQWNQGSLPASWVLGVFSISSTNRPSCCFTCVDRRLGVTGSSSAAMPSPLPASSCRVRSGAEPSSAGFFPSPAGCCRSKGPERWNFPLQLAPRSALHILQILINEPAALPSSPLIVFLLWSRNMSRMQTAERARMICTTQVTPSRSILPPSAALIIFIQQPWN